MFKELSIPIFRNLFLNYLENNIKEVKGEWPNLDVLQVKDDDEIGYTRLARLEEKWLGLNK